MSGLWEALLRLVYPRRATCMSCGCQTGCREDWVCPNCRRRLTSLWVGALLPPAGLEGAAFSYYYAGPAAMLAEKLKYRSLRRMADFMAEDMARAYRFIEPTGVDCVAFVPMHPARRRQRGYNHAELLARAVAQRLELPCLDALERLRNTPQQAKLDAEARRENLRDAIALKQDVAGRRVLLVDDICTTGVTAQTCARALKDGGAVSVYLLCYAKAREHDL